MTTNIQQIPSALSHQRWYNPTAKLNRLAGETSPYLLGHADNPVDWYPWGEDALKRARTENKPIFLSIGYSACHWCHVMEHESFEDKDIAALMNEHFVCIKVDREERPDVDQVYMEAVQAMGLNGGWPLNVFLTPDQKPFYGGTYFPPKQWATMLINLLAASLFDENALDRSFALRRRQILAVPTVSSKPRSSMGRSSPWRSNPMGRS